MAGDVGGGRRALQVGELGLAQLDVDAPVGADLILDVGLEDAADQLVDALAIPPALDVGVTEAERALCEDALVADVGVPRVWPPNSIPAWPKSC